MKAIKVSDQEKVLYAEAATEMIYGVDEENNSLSPVNPRQLLLTRRSADRDNNLWNTFNAVQENLMKGGLRGRNAVTNRRTRTRAIKSIDKNVQLNKALWTLTEKMKELKLAA